MIKSEPEFKNMDVLCKITQTETAEALRLMRDLGAYIYGRDYSEKAPPELAISRIKEMQEPELAVLVEKMEKTATCWNEIHLPSVFVEAVRDYVEQAFVHFVSTGGIRQEMATWQKAKTEIFKPARNGLSPYFEPLPEGAGCLVLSQKGHDFLEAEGLSHSHCLKLLNHATTCFHESWWSYAKKTFGLTPQGNPMRFVDCSSSNKQPPNELVVDRIGDDYICSLGEWNLIRAEPLALMDIGFHEAQHRVQHVLVDLRNAGQLKEGHGAVLDVVAERLYCAWIPAPVQAFHRKDMPHLFKMAMNLYQAAPAETDAFFAGQLAGLHFSNAFNEPVDPRAREWFAKRPALTTVLSQNFRNLLNINPTLRPTILS